MKKSFSFLAMALTIFILSACSSEQTTHTQEWSSETTPNETTTDKETTSETPSSEEAPTEEVSSPIPVGTWTLDVNKSIVTWTGSKIVGASHTGVIQVKEGDLIVGEEGPTGGEFVMDMTTIKDEKGDATLETHLKSDDFFSVEKFPEAKLVIKDIKSAGADQYDVNADLTIRGITKPITFEATAQNDETEKTLVVTAAFQIDRTQWDIKFDSSSFVQNLGDNAINDEIEFDLDLGLYLKEA